FMNTKHPRWLGLYATARVLLITAGCCCLVYWIVAGLALFPYWLGVCWAGLRVTPGRTCAPGRTFHDRLLPGSAADHAPRSQPLSVAGRHQTEGLHSPNRRERRLVARHARSARHLSRWLGRRWCC